MLRINRHTKIIHPFEPVFVKWWKDVYDENIIQTDNKEDFLEYNRKDIEFTFKLDWNVTHK